jgi:hypothetical protein
MKHDPVLTEKEIRAGWEKTFSTTNPFCPCDLHSFVKASRWAEYFVLSKLAEKSEPVGTVHVYKDDTFTTDTIVVSWKRSPLDGAQLYTTPQSPQLLEGVETFGEMLASWAKAYPLDIFPEPDMKKAHAALQAEGMTLDAVSASNMRHVVTTLNKDFDVVRAAIETNRGLG